MLAQIRGPWGDYSSNILKYEAMESCGEFLASSHQVQEDELNARGCARQVEPIMIRRSWNAGREMVYG